MDATKTAPEALDTEAGYDAVKRLIGSDHYGVIDEDKALKGISEIKMPTFGVLDSGYWERALKGIMRRTLYGRVVGTYVYTWLEEEVPRAYEKKGGEDVYTGVGYDILRGGARGLNAAYDTLMGKDASEYELTEEGKAHFAKNTNPLNRFLVNQFGLVRHDVDPNERDENGKPLYRKRLYTMNSPQLAEYKEMEALRASNSRFAEIIATLRDQVDSAIIEDIRRFDEPSFDTPRLLKELHLAEKGTVAPEGWRFISKEHIALIHEFEEALQKETWQHGPDKDKAPLHRLLQLETKLSGKEIDYGQYQMRLGTGFAFMGLFDYASHKTVERIAGTVQFIDKVLDPKWRKSPEFEVWKKNFNLFGSVKKFASDIAIDSIRGDGLYDFFAGLTYAPIKEYYSRQQGGIERKIVVNNGTVDLERDAEGKPVQEGTGLKDSNTLFNVPFVMYNWLGKFVWQDLLIDWWLVPGQSKLRNYFKEHDKDNEGLALPLRAWNRVVQFSSFCVQRTMQVWAFMWPAVSQGFSRWRYYGKNAVQELSAVRRDEVKGTVIEAMFDAVAAPDKAKFVHAAEHRDVNVATYRDRLEGEGLLEKLVGRQIALDKDKKGPRYTITRDENGHLVIPPEVIKAIKEAAEARRTHVSRSVVDLVSEDVRRYKTRERCYDIAEAMFEVLAVDADGRSLWGSKQKGDIKEALAAAGRNAEAEFYIKYITGERPRVNFVPEQEDREDRSKLLAGVGEGVKKFTEVYSGGVQQVNLLKLVKHAEAELGQKVVAEVQKGVDRKDYARALLTRAVEEGVITVSNIKYEVKNADQTAGAYVGYAPYFALKDAFTEIVENNPTINIPIKGAANFMNAFTFKSKHNRALAQEKNIPANGSIFDKDAANAHRQREQEQGVPVDVNSLYGGERVVESHTERLDRRTQGMQQAMLRDASAAAPAGHAGRFQKTASYTEQVQQATSVEPLKH